MFLEAVLLVNGDKAIHTPTYYGFDLYRPHKGAHAAHCRRCYRHNTFEQPNLVRLSAAKSVPATDGRLSAPLPPAGVTRIMALLQ